MLATWMEIEPKPIQLNGQSLTTRPGKILNGGERVLKACMKVLLQRKFQLDDDFGSSAGHSTAGDGVHSHQKETEGSGGNCIRFSKFDEKTCR